MSDSERGERGDGEPVPHIDMSWEKLDEMMKDLPAGMPILPPHDAGNFEKYTNQPRHKYAKGDGWKNCARALEKYDNELCKGYREEIDTLLVFAGLFSAVVTAFTIESYQWLEADSNETIIKLLSQIASSAEGNNVPPISASAGLPDSVSVRINIYWFLALAISLSAALVAILCKQWIHEFERNVGLTPEEFVGIHHTKLEGLENWRVGGIISVLPLLLQSALALFALGVLELLWNLHAAVAVVVCAPTLTALIFYSATTILPVLQDQYLDSTRHMSAWKTLSMCPYKSPQAMLAFRARQLWLSARNRFSLLVSAYRFYRSFKPISSWNELSRDVNHRLDRVYDLEENLLPLSMYRSLRWIHLNLDDGDISEWVWHCLWETAEHPIEFASSVHLLYTHNRGLFHVYNGFTGDTHRDRHALALAYLMETHTHEAFAMEACIQNLGARDPVAAEDVTRTLIDRPGYHIDPEAAVTMFRAARVCVSSDIQRPLGRLLLNVFELVVRCSDPQLKRVLSDCTCCLYLLWLHAQQRLDQETIYATNEMTFKTCIHLTSEPEDHCAHLAGLRLRPRVLVVAELMKVYAELHNDPVAALVSGSLGIYRMQRVHGIVHELLRIARYGIGEDEAAGHSAADNSTDNPLAHPVIVSRPVGHWPDEPALSGTAQSQSTETEEPESTAELHMRRGMAVEQEGMPCDSERIAGHGPPSSPALLAVVFEAPPYERPREDGAGSFRLVATERDAETTGDNDGTHMCLLQATSADGACGLAGAPASPIAPGGDAQGSLGDGGADSARQAENSEREHRAGDRRTGTPALVASASGNTDMGTRDDRVE